MEKGTPFAGDNHFPEYNTLASTFQQGNGKRKMVSFRDSSGSSLDKETLNINTLHSNRIFRLKLLRQMDLVAAEKDPTGFTYVLRGRLFRIIDKNTFIHDEDIMDLEEAEKDPTRLGLRVMDSARYLPLYRDNLYATLGPVPSATKPVPLSQWNRRCRFYRRHFAVWGMDISQNGQKRSKKDKIQAREWKELEKPKSEAYTSLMDQPMLQEVLDPSA
ncbi:hypothetical protein Tco_0400343 [Tanacetum coccineum]